MFEIIEDTALPFSLPSQGAREYVLRLYRDGKEALESEIKFVAKILSLGTFRTEAEAGRAHDNALYFARDTGCCPLGLRHDLPDEYYRLGGRIVLPAKGGWIQTDFFDDPNFDDSHDLSGRAYVAHGFLWLTSWKERSTASFATPAERDAYLESLPPWPLTLARWAVYQDVFIIDCRTGEIAKEDDPEAKQIREQVDRLRVESGAPRDGRSQATNLAVERKGGS
jgi:hypothetical protein